MSKIVRPKVSLQIEKNYPFVSCICPTYNRRRFLPYLLHIFDSQDYPKTRRELIILDDSPESSQDIIDTYKKDNLINYIHHPEKLHLGKKRNMLNDLAKGDYIVCFDDDDYYPPTRISKCIRMMVGSKNNLSGSTELYIYFASVKKIFLFGPYGPRHCTNGTMAYKRDFVRNKNHYYEETATKAEEKFFLKDFSEPMIQLKPDDVMLCISHGENTVDKRRIMSMGKETKFKLKDFVKDKYLLQFYNEITEECQNLPPPEPLELENGQITLDDVESGRKIVSKESVENLIKTANKDGTPSHIIRKLENILEKMNKGELPSASGDGKIEQKVSLEDIASGKVNIPIETLMQIYQSSINNDSIPQHAKERFKNILDKKIEESGLGQKYSIDEIEKGNADIPQDVLLQMAQNNDLDDLTRARLLKIANKDKNKENIIEDKDKIYEELQEISKEDMDSELLEILIDNKCSDLSSDTIESMLMKAVNNLGLNQTIINKLEQILENKMKNDLINAEDLSQEQSPQITTPNLKPMNINKQNNDGIEKLPINVLENILKANNNLPPEIKRMFQREHDMRTGKETKEDTIDGKKVIFVEDIISGKIQVSQEFIRDILIKHPEMPINLQDSLKKMINLDNKEYENIIEERKASEGFTLEDILSRKIKITENIYKQIKELELPEELMEQINSIYNEK